MTKRLSEISKLCSNSDVFEIGCGAGALLHSIKLHTGCKISGIDYSQSLIEIAKHYLGKDFKCMEANSNWDISKKDAILSHSVYNYFPNMDYVTSVNKQIYTNLKIGGTVMLLI